jgi:hypothetical protein
MLRTAGMRASPFLLSLFVSGAVAIAQVMPSPSTISSAARVVIFNDSGRTLVPTKLKITDNGQPLASLGRQTYVSLTLPAGSHELRPDPFLWKQVVVLDLQPGTTRYVVIAYNPSRSWATPVAGAPLLMREITAEEAAPLLKEMKEQAIQVER